MGLAAESELCVDRTVMASQPGGQGLTWGLSYFPWGLCQGNLMGTEIVREIK